MALLLLLLAPGPVIGAIAMARFGRHPPEVVTRSPGTPQPTAHVSLTAPNPKETQL